MTFSAKSTGKNILFCACIFLGLTKTYALEADTTVTGPLPTPVGLEKDVQFWEKVFSEYSPDQCVFHDEWNLDVLYYTANVPRVSSTKGSKLLRQHLKSIRLALQNIAARGKPAGKFEEKIYDAVPSHLRTRSFFTEADTRIRCQRGVEFDDSLKRSLKFVPAIKEVLREKGMPEDLAYLPHLESGFNTNAVSRAGAKGLWQFMAHTARSEGLRVRKGKGNDWRTDPLKSTDAATDYLASIYLRVRCWELAITSYNYGPNGIIRAVKKFGPEYMKIRTEHKTKIFGFAARNYYPSFLAVRNVAMRAEQKLNSLKNFDSPSTVIAEEDDVRKHRRIF